jgi:hypothetical protein
MISFQEGRQIAEAQAWAEHGKRNGWWYIYGRRMAPFVLAVAAIALLVAGVRWAVLRVSQLFSGSMDVDVPGLAWLVAGGLFLLTVLAIKGRAYHQRSVGVLVVTGAGVVAMWLGFGLYLIGATG